MEFINQGELNLIKSSAGKEVDETNHNKLKKTYEKLEYICTLLRQKGFEYSIRKDPRKQAGRSGFVFQNYQWAKLYPAEYYAAANDKLAYIILLTDRVSFHLMGIKDFQYANASELASQKCWIDIEIEGADYDRIVNQFIDFDNNNRCLFVTTGAALGITEFIKIKNKMKKNTAINLLKYKKQIILQGPPGTGKTRLAKEIALDLMLPKEINEEQIRGMLSPELVIKSSKNYTEYTIKNIGINNVTVSLKDSENEYKPGYSEITNAYKIKMWDGKQEKGNDPYASAIAKYIYENLIDTDNYKIIQFHPSYSYEDFVRGITAKANEKGQIEYNVENKALAEFAEKALQNPSKDYVLIIDEINRANLPAVLGELIYALEYRDNPVGSLYELNGDREIVLPANLYIIGTMNTADRRVGHIDYAIRRRFAFVDMVPEDLSGTLGNDFKKELFNRVYNLFYDNEQKNLSSEFSPSQVCLGHSYFIQQYEKDTKGNNTGKLVDFQLRIKYEIIPILEEYIKDGVLLDTDEVRKVIAELKAGTGE